MSFRAGLLPQLLQARPSPSFFAKRSIHFPRSAPVSRTLTLARPRPSRLPIYSLGLGLTFLTYSTFSAPKLQCQSALPSLSSNPRPEVGGGNPPPHSEISAYQLSFGAVCGICTGIFVKKGLKAIAFLLGGAFVLMQYLSSKRFITVDWSKFAGTYDRTFGTKTPTGEVRPPSVGGVWAWFVDFVTANFQQRATFLAGLALGFRLG